LRNKSDVISFLEREIRFAAKELDNKEKSTHEYRKVIIQKVNDLTIQYPDTIPAILQALLGNFLCLGHSKQEDCALDSAIFVREVMEMHQEFRNDVAESIRENLHDIKSPKALRVLIWCLGEYSETEESLQKTFETIMENIGPLPLKISVKEKQSGGEKIGKNFLHNFLEETKQKIITKTVILPDGSYGTETVVVQDKSKQSKDDKEHETKFPLREFIEGEEYFL